MYVEVEVELEPLSGLRLVEGDLGDVTISAVYNQKQLEKCNLPNTENNNQ